MSNYLQDIKFYLFKNSKWNGECLETTYKNKIGKRTPQICYKKKNISVHRASWMIHYGEIPKGMLVCHHCDNPKCFRIEHLFLGTAKDNMQDMVRKKRDNIFGRRKYSFELLEKAAKLREFGKTYKEISQTLGCSCSGISAYLWRNKINKPTTKSKNDLGRN